MSELRLPAPKVIGLWTRLLLHPKQAPPADYGRLKGLLSSLGGILGSEENPADRTPEQILATPAKERTLSLWQVSQEKILLREDGIMFISDLSAGVATLLHEVVKAMEDWPQLQTFSLAPAVPGTEVLVAMMQPAAEIIAPLDQGPFQNARFWTTVNHIQDGFKTRERFFEKQGITLDETPEEAAPS